MNKSKGGVSKRELEEIKRHLETAAVNINSGLADWVDIVPGLKQTEAVVKIYEDVIKAYIEKILKSKKELVEAGENKELKKQLGKRIRELEKEVRELRNQQFGMLDSGVVVSSASPSLGSISHVSPLDASAQYYKTCFNCGKMYVEENIPSTFLLSNITNLCPECKKKGVL